jgi:hypothetical protein
LEIFKDYRGHNWWFYNYNKGNKRIFKIVNVGISLFDVIHGDHYDNDQKVQNLKGKKIEVIFIFE